MPLLDLKTTLKDLKFVGPAPYVRKDINNPGAPAAGEVQARLDDVSRIAGMLADKPGGIFLAKQGLLQASQITNLTDLTLANTVIPVAARLESILAQIPVNRTGTHFSSVDFSGNNATYLRTGIAANEAKFGGRVTGTRNSRFTNPVFKYQQLLKNPDLLNYSTNVGRTTGANLAERNGEVKISSFNPDVQNKETYGLSKQVTGGFSLDRLYGFAGANTKDSVNLLDIGQNGDDLVPFKVNIVGNINSLLVFRGFYENISDNYNGTWSDTNYIGRAESLYVYNKFSRTLNFTFKVPVFSADEQNPVYNKVNSLVSYTAPSYNDGFPQGTILQLEIGEYIKTNGVLNSVNVTVDTNVPWSVGSTNRLLPQVLTLSVNFSIIHSVIPATTITGNKPYIASEQQQVVPVGRIQPSPSSLEQVNAASNDRTRENFQFGRELGQAVNNLISGLGTVRVPTLSPRQPRPVIEVGDGTFGPPIFDSDNTGG